MYGIELVKERDYYKSYCFKTKNNHNQTLRLDIFNSDWSGLKTSDTYAVRFFITSKRKRGYQYLTQTGMDGIKSLLWAKKCILYFIENVLNKGDKIVIYADNKKRMIVYEHGLKSIGFRLIRVRDGYCLMYNA